MRHLRSSLQREEPGRKNNNGYGDRAKAHDLNVVVRRRYESYDRDYRCHYGKHQDNFPNGTHWWPNSPVDRGVAFETPNEATLSRSSTFLRIPEADGAAVAVEPVVRRRR